MNTTCAERTHGASVCWTKVSTHQEWYEHATLAHGAELAEFGYDQARSHSCPGEQHARQLPGYGRERVRKVRPEPRPFTAKDGTVYTPVPLPVVGA